MAHYIRLLSEAELNDAISLVHDRAARPFRNASIFREAIAAFLADADREQGARSVHRIVCVDTTEIVAYANYDRAAWRSFTFGGLLEPEGHVPRSDVPRVREKLLHLDFLINWHLLFERGAGFVLLDPHSDELDGIADLLNGQIETLDNTLYQVVEKGDLLKLTPEQLNRVIAWITSPTTDQRDEFETFRNTFLPHLRSDFVSRFAGLLKGRDNYTKFRNRARFRFLAPSGAGERSFLKALHNDGVEFVWKDYEKFRQLPEVREQCDAVVDVVERMLEATERDRMTSGAARQVAINRDARAIATLHELNLFLRAENLPARAEFVTRAALIHSVIGALPPNRIHVTVRHPLLMPEIYRFDPSSLQTLSHLFESVSNALLPIARGEVPHSVFPQVEPFVRAAGRELVNALSDLIVVRHTFDQPGGDGAQRPAETLHSLWATSKDAPEAVRDDNFSNTVGEIFERLRDSLQAQRDPFSIEAINAIADNNYKLIEIERARLGDMTNKPVRFRYVQITASPDWQGGGMPGAPKGFPISFAAFRLLGGRITRMFHLYSKNLPRLFAQTNNLDAERPRIAESSISSLLDHASRTLEKSSRGVQSMGAENQIEQIETTMLACLAFASLGRFSTSITLASTILNRIMRQLRIVETGTAKLMARESLGSGADPRLALALKELFIMRQYCERAMAREDLEPKSGMFGWSRRSGIRHFDRAERDLYLAVRMSEHADILATGSDGDWPSPEGSDWFEDQRIALICFFGWIDHYIAAYGKESDLDRSLASRWNDTVASELWRQHQRWTSTSWARDIEMLAHRADLRRRASRDPDQERYFAYVEHSAFHGLLVLFLSELAFDLTSETQVFWNPYARPDRDRTLAFGKWRTWYDRYAALSKTFDFSSRLDQMFGVVFGALLKIADLAPPGAQIVRAESLIRHVQILSQLESDLVACIEAVRVSEGAGEVSFIQKVTGAILARVRNLARGLDRAKAS